MRSSIQKQLSQESSLNRKNTFANRFSKFDNNDLGPEECKLLKTNLSINLRI